MDKFTLKDAYHALAKLPKLDPFLNQTETSSLIYMVINFSDKR